MNIPNDTGYPYRLLKYVEYHMSVPPIEPATIIPFCKRNSLTEDECILIAWYNSMCYCAPTALFLFTCIPKPNKDLAKRFWEYNKENLLFVSARRYVKNMDWFVPLMERFCSETENFTSLSDWLKRICVGSESSEESYEKIYRYLMKWPYMGRFSVELFTDMLVHMWDENLISVAVSSNNTEFDWEDGRNVTSGLLNMFYRDEEADLYDKTHRVTEEQKLFLNEAIKEVQAAVKYYHPEQDVGVSVITPKICSWRNLFKGKRYGGYHHDRQLEQLRHYARVYPDYSLWGEIFSIRQQIHPRNLLGEWCGWEGVRKERKTLWIREGKTGVEDIYDTQQFDCC
jgi:hypothetical protein